MKAIVYTIYGSRDVLQVKVIDLEGGVTGLLFRLKDRQETGLWRPPGLACPQL